METVRCAYSWVQEAKLTGGSADAVFAGAIQELNGTVYPVLASDRRGGFWNPGLKRMDQFDMQVLAVSLGSEGGVAMAAPRTSLPFGEIPWWITGGNGLVATRKGANSIFLAPSSARNNIAASDVSITFSDSGDTAILTWTTQGQGQVGLLEKRTLNRLSGDARRSYMESLCRSAGNVEILTAQVNGAEDPTAAYELECSIESFDVTADGQYSAYKLRFDGPWLGPVPDLPEGERTHPVVFDYPRVDVAHIRVDAPPGFVPGDPPGPRTVESPFGRYQMSVKRTEDGFLVERAFALLPLAVPADEYDDLRRYLRDVLLADETPLPFVRSVETS